MEQPVAEGDELGVSGVRLGEIADEAHTQQARISPPHGRPLDGIRSALLTGTVRHSAPRTDDRVVRDVTKAPEDVFAAELGDRTRRTGAMVDAETINASDGSPSRNRFGRNAGS